ncbi:MAG: hypothetical protein F6J90_04440 [Moorea sp. SIOASIH]|uniref:hypothetical protein n=1 Tax=Moorena sp. SIOASIH TaxID=2607817 RepID=UPI0013B9CFCE|nr:hypothetical protein [Moorena sp. SIOASIH]NEO35604.1 hypothetical protein [Moorena sp. SIOASIH]
MKDHLISYHVDLPTRQVRSHSERVGWANSVPKAISSYILTICPPYFIRVRTLNRD